MNGHDLRARLDTGEPVLMPGVWDALSARMAHQAGHEVAFLSGYSVSATLLGLPDFGYLTQMEMAEVARRVCQAAPELMVIVDADTGYGNSLNTIRTVELWEAAGATGMFLEDQVWPKKCGHMAGKQVVPVEDWLSKLKAAVATRDHLHITARTDARAAVSLEDAIDRARRALDVGVDAVFIEAPEALPDCVRVANMIESGKTPLLTPAELHNLGFDLIVAPLGGLYAAVKALRGAYATLAEKGTLRDDLDQVMSFDEFNALVDLDAHYETEERFR